MEHLDDITADDLRRALDEVTEKKPAQRLMAAIAYKNGVSQTELAEWYGVSRRTIYSWLTRLDAEPLERAAADDQRSGRPRKLDEDERTRVAETIRDAPTAVGYDASTWTPELVQRYLDETFDVAYSRPSCRRLMKEAGLRYRRPSASETSAPDRNEQGDDAERGGRWVPR